MKHRSCARPTAPAHRTPGTAPNPCAENGFGPHGGADGELSDAQLAALLPSLKQPDYYTEPSLQQVGVCMCACVCGGDC